MLFCLRCVLRSVGCDSVVQPDEWGSWRPLPPVSGISAPRMAFILGRWIMGRTPAVDRWFRTPHTGHTSVSLQANTNCHTHTFIAKKNITRYLLLYHLFRSRDSLAATQTRLRAGRPRNRGLIPGRGKWFVSSSQCENRLWCPPSLFSGHNKAVGTWS
jgi:hypothetical protein